MDEFTRENNSNTKQILLSVVGIAVLIVAVVGISFAAFSYSKKGQTINTISTGTISMSYTEDTNGINITDAVPMSVADGRVIQPVTGTANDTVFDFTVSANIVGNAQIGYEVVAVKNNTPNSYCSETQSTVIGYVSADGVEKLFAETDTNSTAYTETKTVPADAQREVTNYTKCNIIPDSAIKLYLEKEQTVSGTTSYVEEMAPASWTTQVLSEATDSYGGPAGTMLLTTGTFPIAGDTQSVSYRLRMWVDSSYVVDGTSRTYAVKVNVYGKGL